MTTEIMLARPSQFAQDYQRLDGNPTSGANSDPVHTSNDSPIRGKNRLSYDQASRRIDDRGRGLLSLIVPIKRLRVEGDRLIAPEGEFHLDETGHQTLANHLKAPYSYMAELPVRLRDDLLTYHLKSGDGSKADCVHYRDGRFVGLGRLDLVMLEPREVLNAVRDGFGTDALDFEAEEPVFGHESFRLDLISSRIVVEARRGDILQAGVRVEHSLLGEGATTVLPFVVRLQCTNGMVHRQCLKSSERPQRTRRLSVERKNARSLQIEQVERLANEARHQLNPILESIGKLAQKRADQGQLRRFLGQARMSSRNMMNQLRAAWEEEEDEPTAFGLFNALTRLATHGTNRRYQEAHPREAIVSTRQRATLARLAGIYANSSNHICPHCFSVLNASSVS